MCSMTSLSFYVARSSPKKISAANELRVSVRTGTKIGLVRNCFDLIVLVGERESRQKPAFIVTAILLFCFYGYNLKKLRSEIGKSE